MQPIILGICFIVLGIFSVVGGCLLRRDDVARERAAKAAAAAEEAAIPANPPPGWCIVTDGARFRPMRSGGSKIILKDGSDDAGYADAKGALKRAWRQYEYELKPKEETDYGLILEREQRELHAAFKPVDGLCAEEKKP